MTTSSAERSSSDVICRIKGGVFLMIVLALANLMGTGMSIGSGIALIMSADTLTAPSSFLSVWRVDWLGGNTYAHQGSTGGLEFPPEVGSMQVF